MQVQDIMTKAVVTVSPADTIAKLIEVMTSRGLSGLPVIGDNRRLAGMVTEGDLLRRPELGTEPRHSSLMSFLLGSDRLAREYVHAASRTVADLMTTDVASIGPEASLVEVVELMEARHVKRLPVVRNGVCIGIVSRADIVRALGAQLAQPAGATDDAGIEARIERDLKDAEWANPSLTVRVRDGRVAMRGTVFHDSERQAFQALVLSVPGVVSCRDELIWIEPVTGAVCSYGEAA